MKLQLGLALLLLSVMPAQAQETADVKDQRDPFESFNRAMWYVNYNILDPVARPVVHAYDDYMPQPVKTGFSNFFDNFDAPFSAANHLLQWKPKKAGIEVLRFTINSTVGIFGIFDIASDMGLPAHHQEEFGEVMHKYGIPSGPYLMLPLFGPTTVRDGAGDLVDGLYFPYNHLNQAQTIGRWTMDGINDRAQVRDQEPLLDNALDPYVFVREAYFQMREYDIYDGKVPEQPQESDEWLDDYLDEIDE
ncbi:MlaA family lipoprotein [Ferrimonas senticii]|uniref:MlaA family lipoprotein n=1 Tax=Ferrimonas senticii TaxID=394566 RepID=UPI00041AE546|nr:VacJ family lipoprotein [Ferrimonas senticii]